MPSSARCRRPRHHTRSRHTPRSVGTHNARKPPHTSASPAPLNTLRRAGHSHQNYYLARIIRDTAHYRGRGYGWGLTLSSDEWNQAVARHRRPARHVDLPDRVAAIVDPVLAHLELHLVDVPLLAEGLAELRRGRVALHLAVLIGQDYDWVLDGSKTIESRFARVRLTPWQAVDVGDLVLIKRPGRPIGGIFRAGVTTHHELVGDTAAELRRRFALRMRATDNEFWTARSHARYATLVNVTVPRPIPALVVPKRDQRGWVILTPRQHP